MDTSPKRTQRRANLPQGLMHTLRLDRARQLLSYSHLSVGEIAAACGFAEVASLSHAYTRRFGVSPSRSRQDHTGLPARPESQVFGVTSTR